MSLIQWGVGVLEGEGTVQLSGGCGYRTQLCVLHCYVKREWCVCLVLGVLGETGRYRSSLSVGNGTCPHEGGNAVLF